jgi:polyphosphate kinase
VLFPILDRRLTRYLRDEVLDIYLKANKKVRVLQANGSYSHLLPTPGDPLINPQDWLIQLHQRAKG